MRALILSCLLLLTTSLARAAEPSLDIAVGGEARTFTRDAMLAMPEDDQGGEGRHLWRSDDLSRPVPARPFMSPSACPVTN
jgi:hypothetical protein